MPFYFNSGNTLLISNNYILYPQNYFFYTMIINAYYTTLLKLKVAFLGL
jgi:hypothetical protein